MSRDSGRPSSGSKVFNEGRMEKTAGIKDRIKAEERKAALGSRSSR